MIQAIHNEMFEIKSFNFEENYDKLIKRFRHMSLFSVFCIFWDVEGLLKKKYGYCKVCSSVRENCFYDLSKFSNLIVRSDLDDNLHITSSDRVDLDVFVNCLSYFEYLDYELVNGKCC